MTRRAHTRVPSVADGGFSPVVDAWGVGLLLAVIAWVSLAPGGAVQPLRDLVLVAGVVFFSARLISFTNPWIVGVMTASVIAAVGLAAGAEVFDHLRGPVGYANATGQLFVSGSAAALLVVVRTRNHAVRVPALIAAAGLASVGFLNGSLTSAALGALQLVSLVGLRGARAVRATVLAAGALALLAVLTTIAVGAVGPAAMEGLVEGNLTTRRVALWNEAIAIVVENPATGVGVGRFAETSPTALSDPDAAWAHHEFLELAAETGVPALLLVAAFIAWIFVILAGRSEPGSAVGAAALAALVIHASMDYVLHFPAVVVAAAAVIGAASAAPTDLRRAAHDPEVAIGLADVERA